MRILRGDFFVCRQKRERGNTPKRRKEEGETPQNRPVGPHAVHWQKTSTITRRIGKPKNEGRRKLKNTQRRENPKTHGNPWSLTKTRTPPMRKTQKLEDERWLWTTAGTNKQTNLFFHILFICFQTPAGSKRYFSSKIEKKYLLDEKQRQIWIACTFIWRGRTHIGVLYTGGTKKGGQKRPMGTKPLRKKRKIVALISLWRWAMLDDFLEMRIHMMLGQPVYAELCVVDDRM